MRLLAISDLHVGHEKNRELLATVTEHRQDWLIVAGDVGETEEHLVSTLRLLVARFARVFWVPGNHELWTVPAGPGALRGEAKYARLVALCRELGVVTPEDEYVVWPGAGPPCVLAPLFLLYDYSFRPRNISEERALAWAEESGVVCSDEFVLHPDPYPSRQLWCAARCARAEERLAAIPSAMRTVLINHFPLREDLAILPAVPRFSLWCGTRRTDDWHVRFRALAVVSGHLHIRGTRFRDGVRFEEVSLGYPRNWTPGRGLDHYLREILPGLHQENENKRTLSP